MFLCNDGFEEIYSCSEPCLPDDKCKWSHLSVTVSIATNVLVTFIGRRCYLTFVVLCLCGYNSELGTEFQFV